MKTIISGRVEPRHLDDADLIAGIVPTSFITNGDWTPPASQLTTEVDPPSPMLPGEVGEHQRNWTMCLAAEALICVGHNPHLVHAAERNRLRVYEVDE